MDIASSSDGEISPDEFSDISEDDYFQHLESIIEKRKLELELMNEIEKKNYDDYPKENRYLNNQPNTSSSSSSRKNNNINSVGNKNNNGSKNVNKPRNKELGNRSYRASSALSTSYELPKKKYRQNKKKKRRYKQQKSYNLISLSSDDDDENTRFIDDTMQHNDKSNIQSEEEDEDEELLSLRLQALTSKQEVKELIEPETATTNFVPLPTVSSNQIMPNEEELLRIAALRSAVLKKKDHLKERKKLKMLENERPYSPTDIFEPILFDEAMDLSNSPLESPLNVIETTDTNDLNQEVDMDISNSYPGTPEREISDMEIVMSPQKLPDDINETNQSDDENEEDLRLMLLSNMNEKKKEITVNLKMAVERLKREQQKQNPTSSILVAQKSGTKTIKMILEEKNKKKNHEQTQKVSTNSDINSSLDTQSTNVSNIDNEAVNKISSEQRFEDETILLGKITNLQEQESFSKQLSPLKENNDETSFSTITDTKNIPLLPQNQEIAKNKRLITSLESVIKPVSPLVIRLQAESSDDEHTRVNKKSVRKNERSLNDFEQNLDCFLKNIRKSQEEKSKSLQRASSSTLHFAKSNASQTNNETIGKSKSAVKHLPLSSQMEYESLVKKMQLLQEKKKQRQEQRELKRTKSYSSTSTITNDNCLISKITDTHSQTTKEIDENTSKQQNNVMQKNVNKIDDTLSKIPLLDEAARERLINKTEINFHNHSKNLIDSIEKNMKMLDENALQMKQRRVVETKIQELEKTLSKYKSFLKVVNNKIKSNIPKIILSQRDMIKFRNRQHQFKEICKRVGESVRGEQYGLPDDQSATVIENFHKISNKTEELQHALKEQYASKQLKILVDRIKSFIPANELNENAKTVATSSNKDNNSSAKEREQNNENEKCVNNVEMDIKDINSNSKRVWEVLNTSSMKKIKLYDSPLEYLKHNSGNRNVNDIVCPFALEGTCNDEKCEMIHL
ncbi:hypothetical protein PVAND_008196 [Polypedilum vanderplanki]|uniref:Zinc-finger domain-containing protein n=1 Tax=Polypedilum vanderplanki TaxID=319348 RepID=A0A9J6C8X6_POLVA|nr:hypothetical protein PVAND_008196 [Polypedilum vanderplanki]